LEAGNSCRSLRISKDELKNLRRDGASSTAVERATNVIVIVCEDNNDVVTVMGL
jgi:hypothetical protein